MISPAFRDDVARLDGASAGPIRVRSFGFCTGERMPVERTVMRQVREVLRLTTVGVGLNEIARRVGVASSTVRLTLKRLAGAGLSWPLPAEMTDSALEVALFAAAGTKQGHRRHVEPDWAEIHRELKRKHVTLTMLWDEYIERCPEGYRYSRFCELYRSWASRLSVTMRQAHVGGDKLFVDYAGDTVPVMLSMSSTACWRWDARATSASYETTRARDHCVCESAWNKDPVFGVIGIQSGPRDDGSTVAS